ncbi:MAG TPA: N-acetylglucosamine-6-phosphate deacetylase [Solirubrobacteraceae bacterium]|jgi:N-acetylglucosamine-6-phosphate deacetylase|nr:N-acetylglucosamine-6-phosphate deacetylase [Solirubrobacteraceae bacterium]
MTVADRVDAPAQLLGGGRVVTPTGVLADAWVQIADGRITTITDARPDGGTPVVDLRGAWLLPGYVDLHMHGGGGHNVSESLQAMEAAVAFHRTHGTTATLVSLVTAPERALSQQLGWAAELVRRGPNRRGHVLGSHLEGPFLSARRCGAQNEAHMLAPDGVLLERLRAAAGGTLRMVTIAPELPGALPLIETLSRAGVIAAMGHSDANYEQALQGIRAGAKHATHLFNAMPPLLHRDPGLVGAALESGIVCELINDGRHVHPAIVRLVFELIDAPALVTDAIDATGVGDGHFELGGQEVIVHDREARLAATGSLAGSTLTMDEALRNAVKASGLSVERASAAASLHPARALGRDGELGSIAPGMRADLVVLDDDLRVTRVMAGGSWCELTTS